MYRENGTHNPLYYISTADIRLIAIRKKLDVSRKDKNDLTSVEIRVTENNPEDGFQKYIPPLNDTADGFLLVIITPLQQTWLTRYSRRAVCLDDTFNLTPYALRLTTIVVADEWDRGLPAAFLLSNRVRGQETAELFEAVKQVAPSFNPKYFMTDDASAFFNGFCEVFPESRTRKLLCMYHVLQSVKANCVQKLKQVKI
ncbi:hypothetical protein Q1695_003128 [Nippostrongylus brasiliensis]|nr:hypothetical protein Q1695_003128 [Nippostrongylus brasiliensis]